MKCYGALSLLDKDLLTVYDVNSFLERQEVNSVNVVVEHALSGSVVDAELFFVFRGYHDAAVASVGFLNVTVANRFVDAGLPVGLDDFNSLLGQRERLDVEACV